HVTGVQTCAIPILYNTIPEVIDIKASESQVDLFGKLKLKAAKNKIIIPKTPIKTASFWRALIPIGGSPDRAMLCVTFDFIVLDLFFKFNGCSLYNFRIKLRVKI